MTELATDNEPIVQIRNLTFGWPGASSNVLDLDELILNRGERVFLRGASGSGKTTLLNLIAAVLQASKGSIVVDGIDTGNLPNHKRDRFRADTIGFIFQQFNLLPFLSVTDNVSLPCRFSAVRKQRALAQSSSIDSECRRLLEAMQLPVEAILKTSVTQLSVGQQQRVAVARALIGSPALVIADEPTSALDTDTRSAFINLLFAEAEAAGSSLLFVSHDDSLAMHFDRTIELASINKASINKASMAHSQSVPSC